MVTCLLKAFSQLKENPSMELPLHSFPIERLSFGVPNAGPNAKERIFKAKNSEKNQVSKQNWSDRGPPKDGISRTCQRPFEDFEDHSNTVRFLRHLSGGIHEIASIGSVDVLQSFIAKHCLPLSVCSVKVIWYRLNTIARSASVRERHGLERH